MQMTAEKWFYMGMAVEFYDNANNNLIVANKQLIFGFLRGACSRPRQRERISIEGMQLASFYHFQFRAERNNSRLGVLLN